MNNIIQGTVRELEPRYKLLTDNELVELIRRGNDAGEVLFYLLYGRYATMLELLFQVHAKASLDFEDFILELNIKLFNRGCAAVCAYNERKALFSTYLKRIAHNVLYDMNMAEQPMLNIEALDSSLPDVDVSHLRDLGEIINSYPDADVRFVLFKTIEGYRSKEIAKMLSRIRHEQGKLDEAEELKASYIDTLRSRSLRNIRRKMCPPAVCEETCLHISSFAFFKTEKRFDGHIQATQPESENHIGRQGLIISNLLKIYRQAMAF